MIALTQEKREELIRHCNDELSALRLSLTISSLSHQEVSDIHIGIATHEIALALLMALSSGKFVLEPIEGRYHHIKHVEYQDSEPKLPMLKLFTAPPVPEIKFPEKLPCDVSVSPNVVFRRGVNTQTLLNCLIRKSSDSSEMVK